MNAAALLADLGRRAVVVTVDGDRLTLAGPEDALTDALLAEVGTHKAELLALLTVPEDETMLPPGALPLWLWDRLYPSPNITPESPPAHLSPNEVLEGVRAARLAARTTWRLSATAMAGG